MCDFHPDCAGAEDEAKCGESVRPVSSVLLSTGLQGFKAWKEMMIFIRASEAQGKLLRASGATRGPPKLANCKLLSSGENLKKINLLLCNDKRLCSFFLNTKTVSFWVRCVHESSLQGTSLTLRAAQAGLTPALGVKVGCYMKIPHPKVQILSVITALRYWCTNIQ